MTDMASNGDGFTGINVTAARSQLETLNEMAYEAYNKIYNGVEEALANALGNVDLHEESNRLNNNNVSTNSSSNSDSKNLFQDTPQGRINFAKLQDQQKKDEQILQRQIQDQQWATNYTNNVNDINDSSVSSGENTENYNRHIIGNNGKKYSVEVLRDIQNNIFDIDMMIINQLNDLFMGIF